MWRQVMCPFDRDRRVLQYLVTTPILSEDGEYSLDFTDLTRGTDLYVPSFLLACFLLVRFELVCLFAGAELHLASYESEGPENNLEKDSRRSLR